MTSPTWHPYRPFWRRPWATFDDSENAILAELAAAHSTVAMRGNASGEAFVMAYRSSGQYTHAVTAAMSMLGWPHGPIEQTVEFLNLPTDEKRAWRLHSHGQYPGWGNTFVKGIPDPAFEGVERALSAAGAPVLHVVREAHAIINTRLAKPVPIYPNPSCWTAAVAIHVGMHAGIAPYLFVAARLAAWSEELT